MVDIHNHGLFDVDDGAATLREAVRMLREAKQQGVHAIVLTPHYRHGMFKYRREIIEAQFADLKAEAEQMGMDVYLGCEYHVNSRILEYLESGRCLAMAGGRVLPALVLSRESMISFTSSGVSLPMPT